ADRNRSHWSTSKTPSYTKSVSWQHHPKAKGIGKNILLKLQLVIRISLTASPHHHVIFATS
ncbi:hypothetical protein EXX80_08935, partial [Escherichia coli]|uniref:hypothetical protein n=1 Tax=Escherichia coli TaxID=562 RepID=UPI00102DDC67